MSILAANSDSASNMNFANGCGSAVEKDLEHRCSICGASASRLFTKHGYGILGCNDCGHHFADLNPGADHIAAVYDDSYFRGGGAGYPDYLSEGSILRARGRWYSGILSRYLQPGSVLDVGAAAGFVLQGFVDQGWQGHGIEPNPAMAEYARTQMQLSVETSTLEHLERRRHYDVVSMIQVIAHFMDLRKALQAAADVTRPGGFWLIETWNRASWTAWACGRHWHEYSPPSVLRWFTLGELRRLASPFGFREITRGRPSKWLSGQHAKSLLRHAVADSRGGRIVTRLADLIPDRLSLPYPSEDLAWMLFQKTQSPAAPATA